MTLHAILLGLSPYLILAAMAPYFPRTILGLIMMVSLLLAVWPLPMGEFAWRWWQHGQGATPPAHQADFGGVDKDKVVTFYDPGLGGSWMQGLRYMAQEGLPPSCKVYVDGIAVTPDAHIANAPRLLYNVCPIDPPEVMTGGGPMSLLFYYTVLATSSARVLQRVVMGDDYYLAWPWVNFAQRHDIEAFLTPIRTAI